MKMSRTQKTNQKRTSTDQRRLRRRKGNRNWQPSKFRIVPKLKNVELTKIRYSPLFPHLPKTRSYPKQWLSKSKISSWKTSAQKTCRSSNLTLPPLLTRNLLAHLARKESKFMIHFLPTRKWNSKVNNNKCSRLIPY